MVMQIMLGMYFQELMVMKFQEIEGAPQYLISITNQEA